jgi:hypothetical protein
MKNSKSEFGVGGIEDTSHFPLGCPLKFGAQAFVKTNNIAINTSMPGRPWRDDFIKSGMRSNKEDRA